MGIYNYFSCSYQLGHSFYAYFKYSFADDGPLIEEGQYNPLKKEGQL